MDSMITQCLNKTEITAPCNQNSHFDSLSKEKQEQLIEWCKANFNAIKTFNDGVTSFDLKKAFSWDPKGFYITNGQLKGAMEKAGFSLKATRDGVNAKFNISKTSPFFKKETV